MFDFTGKVAVVTGAEMGIGKAIAGALVGQGASVVIAGVNDEAGNATAAELGKRAAFVRCNVTSAEDVARLAREAKAAFGPVTVLVNNAGIHARGDATATEHAVWNRIMEVNVTGVFLVTQAVLPQMVEAGGGVIVNVSSEAGLVAIPDQIAYNTSKFAVIGFTKSLAVDYASRGVRANAICPGTTQTPLVAQAIANDADPDALRNQLEGSRPAKRLGKPEEIAAAVVALASDDIGYATGAVFSVDGGLTAQ